MLFSFLISLILVSGQPALAQKEITAADNVTEQQNANIEMSATTEALDDLDGKIFHWTYSKLGGGPASFRVLIEDKKLHFQGVAGVVKGAIGTNDPQFSKIDENIYFITWESSHGVESLVLNFDSKKVNAHLQSETAFSAISGDITCNGLIEDCTSPKFIEAK